MAFAATKIFPNDLRPSVAIGFDLPLNGEAVFISNYQTKDAIKNNLINYFFLNPGERPGNPSFGAGLRKYVFEQITNDNLDFIKEDIQQKILNNFPNVLIQSVETFQNPDFNTIMVSIKYNVRDTGINDQLELSFS